MNIDSTAPSGFSCKAERRGGSTRHTLSPIDFEPLRPQEVAPMTPGRPTLLAAALLALVVAGTAGADSDPRVYEPHGPGDPMGPVGLLYNASIVKDGELSTIQGTAFLVDPDGCIAATAPHVVMGDLQSGLLLNWDIDKEAATAHADLTFVIGQGEADPIRATFLAGYGPDKYDPAGEWWLQELGVAFVRLQRCVGGRYGYSRLKPMSWEDLWLKKIGGVPVGEQMIAAGFPADRAIDRGVSVQRHIEVTNETIEGYYEASAKSFGGNSGGFFGFEATGKGSGEPRLYAVGIIKGSQIDLVEPNKSVIRVVPLSESDVEALSALTSRD